MEKRQGGTSVSNAGVGETGVAKIDHINKPSREPLKELKGRRESLLYQYKTKGVSELNSGWVTSVCLAAMQIEKTKC